MIDEGVIKYRCEWIKEELFLLSQNDSLLQARDSLYRAGLIGVDHNGIGYGNISQRHSNDQFLISGSQTGAICQTKPIHYALVTTFDIEQNTLNCCGMVKASSESLTHAALYQLEPEIQSVVHVHSDSLWKKHKNQLPTTRPEISYGTPQMAHEMQRLFVEENLTGIRVLIMAGHHGGLVSFGTTPENAVTMILSLQ